MKSNYIQKSVEIIRKNIYITLATVSSDGEPWNSPLSVAYDKDLNFYTNSDKNSVHATNIRDNGKIFFVIYDSTVGESMGSMGGVYFKGKGYEIDSKEEILVSRQISLKRKGKIPTENEYQKFSGSSIRRIYKFVPEKAWINDVELDNEGRYIRDIRIEVPMEEIKKYI